MVLHLSIILTRLCDCACLQYFIHTLGKKNISLPADSPCRICDALMKSCTHQKCVGGNNGQRSDQSRLLCLQQEVCLSWLWPDTVSVQNNSVFCMVSSQGTRSSLSCGSSASSSSTGTTTSPFCSTPGSPTGTRWQVEAGS